MARDYANQYLFWAVWRWKTIQQIFSFPVSRKAYKKGPGCAKPISLGYLWLFELLDPASWERTKNFEDGRIRGEIQPVLVTPSLFELSIDF